MDKPANKSSHQTQEGLDRLLRTLHLKPPGSSNEELPESLKSSIAGFQRSDEIDELKKIPIPDTVDGLRDSSFSHEAAHNYLLESLATDLPDYEILDRLGEGGQGVVLKASKRSDGMLVALKVLHGNPTQAMRRFKRFEREIEVISRLDHPNIVRLLDNGIANGRPFFAMEYISGVSIDDYALLNRPTVKACVTIFEKICRAVASAHQRGVIHRDLKPGNILIDLDNEPHILDFGLAKVMDEYEDHVTLSMEGNVLGTLPYLSPEQARGEHKDIDVRSDIYSLGVILYRLLTGTMPYPMDGGVESIRKNIIEKDAAPVVRREDSQLGFLVDGDIPDDLARVILKSIAKDKTRRYQSADAFANDLARFLAGEVVEAKSDSPFYLVRRAIKRHPLPAALFSGIFVVAITAAVIITVLWQRAETIAANAQTALQLSSALENGANSVANGRVDEAIVRLSRSIDLGEQARSPDDNVLLNLVSAHYMIAQLLQNDRTARNRCERELKLGDDILARLSAEHSKKESFLRQLATFQRQRGVIANALGDYNRAEECNLRAAGTFELLMPMVTDKNRIRFEIANCKQEASVAMLDHTVELKHLVPEDQRHLIAKQSHDYLQKSRVLLNEAWEIMSDVTAQDPDSFHYQYELVLTEFYIASSYSKENTSEGNHCAASYLRSTSARLEQLAKTSDASRNMPQIEHTRDAILSNRKRIWTRLNAAANKPPDY